MNNMMTKTNPYAQFLADVIVDVLDLCIWGAIAVFLILGVHDWYTVVFGYATAVWVILKIILKVAKARASAIG